MVIIGRQRELAVLDRIFTSKSPQFCVVYGRRRVGKTFLIDQYFKNKEVIFFTATGQKREDGKHLPAKIQIAQFFFNIRMIFSARHKETPKTWLEAFEILIDEVTKLKDNNSKIILFFDEFPWLASPRSNFYESFSWAMNAFFLKQKNVVVIISGSAASWILKKVVHAKSGLSKRLTHRIYLKPFSLKETREFLWQKGFNLRTKSVIETYMIVGGIPYYLDFLTPSKSIYENINDEFFSDSGNLYDEYETLYDSLFNNADQHKKVLEFIASKKFGVTGNELRESMKRHAIRGGVLSRIIANLLGSNFIEEYPPLFHEGKHKIYRIIDEFTLFYIKWMKNLPQSIFRRRNEPYFTNLANSQSYRTQCGYNFEILCLKHEHSIRKALRIDKIQTINGCMYLLDPKTGKRTSQIDLLFDRADRTITICEIKFYDGPFTITSGFIQNLREKSHALREYIDKKNKPQRDIKYCLISSDGVQNIENFSDEITIDCFDSSIFFE